MFTAVLLKKDIRYGYNNVCRYFIISLLQSSCQNCVAVTWQKQRTSSSLSSKATA